ncbi:MAG: PIG-L family deacetylase [Acidimicrobiia bacterium]|nr:PIG-L family deacetylase [Acidimicrobiia bacterium]
MATVVFVHAHPDDEAIFTAGTMCLLDRAGHRVVLVVATGGELGVPHEDTAGPGHLAGVRREETDAAAALLGVARTYFLGYHDSGMAGSADNDAPGSLWSTDVAVVADRVAEILRDEQADAVVTYDETGIYGHPDHLQVHRACSMAAGLAGTPTVYETTVDREYLHFVETHLVEQAILAGDLGMVRSHLGLPSVMITTAVDVSAELDRKRAAMAAHASQIPETTSAFQLGFEQFAAVYGWEWFVRRGPLGAIDDLA